MGSAFTSTTPDSENSLIPSVYISPPLPQQLYSVLWYSQKTEFQGLLDEVFQRKDAVEF